MISCAHAGSRISPRGRKPFITDFTSSSGTSRALRAVPIAFRKMGLISNLRAPDFAAFS
jgi:hypothetical protein